jgi:hypothetical protein
LLSRAHNRLRFYPPGSTEHAEALLLLERARLHLDIGPYWPKPDRFALEDHAWALDRYRAARDAEETT